MKKQALFLGDPSMIARVYSPELIARLEAELDFPAGRAVTQAELVELAGLSRTSEVEYVFSTWGMPSLGRDDIASLLPSLKALFYAAGSVQDFARPFLDSGVRVFSAWGANGVPVAEFTVAQIILANKGYFQRMHRNYHENGWSESRKSGGSGNYGCEVGIIGCGMIGRLVASMLSAYNLKVLVYDKFMTKEQAAALGVTLVPLYELFSRCSVISNHLANNAATVGMLNYDCFSRMKPDGVFINTGRGAQVVEADMIRALSEETGRIALLDVTYPEPPEIDSPLYTMPNVFLSPHIAGSIADEYHRMSEFMYTEYKSVDAGLPVKYEVTPEMLATMA